MIRQTGDLPRGIDLAFYCDWVCQVQQVPPVEKRCISFIQLVLFDCPGTGRGSSCVSNVYLYISGTEISPCAVYTNSIQRAFFKLSPKEKDSLKQEWPWMSKQRILPTIWNVIPLHIPPSLSLFGRVSFHSPPAYHLLASVRLPLPHSYIFTFRKDVTRYRKRKSPAATMREWAAAAAAAVRGYTPKIHSRNTLPVRGNFFQLSFLSSQPASQRRSSSCTEVCTTSSIQDNNKKKAALPW